MANVLIRIEHGAGETTTVYGEGQIDFDHIVFFDLSSRDDLERWINAVGAHSGSGTHIIREQVFVAHVTRQSSFLEIHVFNTMDRNKSVTVPVIKRRIPAGNIPSLLKALQKVEV